MMRKYVTDVEAHITYTAITDKSMPVLTETVVRGMDVGVTYVLTIT